VLLRDMGVHSSPSKRGTPGARLDDAIMKTRPLGRLRTTILVGALAVARLVVLGAGSAASVISCHPGPSGVVAYSDSSGTYDPRFYDGYVVYFDGAGRPYYYAEGAVVWIPQTSQFYRSLTDDWARHRVPYEHWYMAVGYRYRNVRIAGDGAIYKQRGRSGFW
jgi:hypothetical protein